MQRFEDILIVSAGKGDPGKGDPASVMSEYGFKNVISIDEYALCFENIDPLAPYKKWTTKLDAAKNPKFDQSGPQIDVFSEKVQAAFIVSDPVDWSRDIQVLCDILKTGGLPGRNVGMQPHLYFANDDLEYQTKFPSERLGMGAFRIALESIFNRERVHSLEYTCFGKPHPSVFNNAEIVLQQLRCTADWPSLVFYSYENWCFQGEGNHEKFPADLVVNTVEEAVDYILAKECADSL
ncbi:hypothetical protein P8452_18027 [Trifolium repens]|nr:hypothetical protein P8452_18027 [Trifolium repens]